MAKSVGACCLRTTVCCPLALKEIDLGSRYACPRDGPVRPVLRPGRGVRPALTTTRRERDSCRALSDRPADSAGLDLPRVRHDPARALLNDSQTGAPAVESTLSWIHPLWALGLPIAASVPI